MSRITVLGGTGYAGSHIVREAARRGHQVTSYSRHAPEQPVDGVTYVQADVLDQQVLDQVVAGADVVVHALAPRGELAGKLEQVVADLATRAGDAGVRLGVVGGAGSLRVAPDGPLVMDTFGFPEAALPEVRTIAALLELLRSSAESLDWFYVSPAANFGSHAPGEALGRYRVGGDLLLTDEDGNSAISGADFAAAFLDEIEAPAHRRERFTVAY